MNFFFLRNVNKSCSTRLFYSAFTKQQSPYVRILGYSGTGYLIPTSQFSWTGFYAALSQSTPVITMQSLLVELHHISGLPWWSVILLTTFGIRSLIVFPLTVHQHQVIARLANINAGMGKIATELNKEVNVARKMFNWTEEQAKKVFRIQLKKIHKDAIVRDNCHPFKSALLVLIQVPAWICFSVSLRNLTMTSSGLIPGFVSTEDLNFKNEGVLWFTDLTCPDPIFIPILLAVANLSLIEIHALQRIGKRTLFEKIILNTSRLITIIVAIAATINPSSVTFYWLCSSTIGIGQILLLKQPKVKQILRIPSIGKESLSALTDISNNLKKRITK